MAVSLANRAVRGAAWTITTSISTRALGLVGTLLLVRYLSPDEYGIASAAAVLVMTANQFSTLGVGWYIIAHPKSGRAAVFHATVIHLSLGVLALAGVVMFSGKFGPWLDAPTLSRFVPGLALASLADRITFIPERVLVRDMRFGRIASARSAGEILYTLASVAAAMSGWGGYSIVVGNLARSVGRMVLMVSAAPRREWLEVTPISGPMMRAITGYGVVLSVSGVASMAARRWDNLLVSHYFGPSVMGAYNLAYNLADIPAVQVGEQVTDILVASFVQMEPKRRPQALLRAFGLLGLIMFPLAVGLGTIAPTVVKAAFRDRWAEVGPMLMILSVLSVPRPLSGALGAYLQARHRQKRQMVIDLAQLAVLMGAIAAVGKIGPLWACVAVGAVFSARTFANLVEVKILDALPVRDFLVRLAPPLAACLPMVAAVLGTRYGLHALGLRSAVIGLCLETTAGAIAYVLGALVIARSASRELIALGRRALHRGEDQEPEPKAAA